MILKPMNVGEILDNAFTMFKEQFKSYLAIAALGAVPTIGFSLLVLCLYFLFEGTAAVIAFSVIPVVSAVMFLVVTGGLIKKVSEQIPGREISVMEAYRFGIRKTWRLFLGSLLYVLAIAFGFILLIIPGIYLSIRFALYSQAVIIEDKGPWSALKRSSSLIGGYWWRSFGIIFLITVLLGILSTIVSFPFSLMIALIFGEDFFWQVVNTIITTLISFLLYPFSMIAFTLYYYDLRVRKENLDLKIMVDSLAESDDKLPGE
ncbi:MAG: glycerophosphoryl diester phosphodiesterase membrane domain-containing protein [Peptococcaceae bacterium]|nr:glycerophosphoryl diester phosphodiesterase membrane domain-containing protein [Peptococcaceae bacterium]